MSDRGRGQGGRGRGRQPAQNNPAPQPQQQPQPQVQPQAQPGLGARPTTAELRRRLRARIAEARDARLNPPPRITRQEANARQRLVDRYNEEQRRLHQPPPQPRRRVDDTPFDLSELEQLRAHRASQPSRRLRFDADEGSQPFDLAGLLDRPRVPPPQWSLLPSSASSSAPRGNFRPPPQGNPGEIIARTREGRQSPEDAIELQRLMLHDERTYSDVASDPALFPRLYHRVKDPSIDPGYRFSRDPGVEAASRAQHIHSTYDQLHYILWRTGAGPRRPRPQLAPDAALAEADRVRHTGELIGGPGLAERPGEQRRHGTERGFQVHAGTARAVQIDAITRLIALHAGQTVRMPAYGHRAGPMLAPQNLRGYEQAAANSFNAIMTSPDTMGANIRVTQADRGPGAYVSTDSDNYYGPHGFAFDPRDLHQLPLSTSQDNTHEVSSERTRHQRHQFRAMSASIPLTENGQPAYSDVFAETPEHFRTPLRNTLTPQHMTQGVLSDVGGEAIRAYLRHTMMRQRVEQIRRENALGGAVHPTQPPPVIPPAPTRLHNDPDREQPRSSAQTYLMRGLVHELNGLYEPHAWADSWRTNPQEQLLASMVRAFNESFASRGQTEQKGDSDSNDDDWL